jgi:AcrR family transcriptional regulator
MAAKARRAPRQTRSKDTVAVILEATTQILIERGSRGLTTNHVAARAGVSIGTLYQYFSNKQDLVMAVVNAHIAEMLELLRVMVFDTADLPISVTVRRYVQGMVEAHSVNPELHRACLEQTLSQDPSFLFGIQARAAQLVQAYLAMHAHAIQREDLAAAAYVLVVSVDTLIHTAMMDPGAPDLATVEVEIVAFILGYLGVDDTAS